MNITDNCHLFLLKQICRFKEFLALRISNCSIILYYEYDLSYLFQQVTGLLSHFIKENEMKYCVSSELP